MTYEAGETVYEQGCKGSNLYVVAEGSLDMYDVGTSSPILL